LSFAPLAKYRPQIATSLVLKTAQKPRTESKPQTTKQIGDSAEDIAVEYLRGLGHDILERNWKTKFCEIDSISLHGQTFYFTEVKYRRSAVQGGGLAAITAKKQQQMRFAAEFYAASHKLKGVNLQLLAIATSGQPPVVTNFLQIE